MSLRSEETIAVQSWITRLVFSIVSTGFAGLVDVKADQPVIEKISPVGVVRGEESEMLLVGQRLSDATDILFYQSGIELLGITAEPDGKKAVARIRVSQDCQPGLHSCRLAARSGISNLRYFGVGDMPIIDEVEPNNDFASPQIIPLNVTVHGLCTNEDVDYFQVDLEQGQTLNVELEGIRLGTDFFDPFVAILDEKRYELARSDDATLVQQDCICSYTATTKGPVIIQVRESSFGGNNRAHYRLHVGDFPRPLVIHPAGGQPGELIDAEIVDASGQKWRETIQLPDELGDFQFTVSRDGKLAPSPNTLRITELPNHFEHHLASDAPTLETDAVGAHQDYIASLPAIALPAALNGVLTHPGQVDWFRIIGTKDQTVELTVYGRQTLRSPLDSLLEIYNTSGGRLAANDDNGGSPDSFLSYKFPEDGEYLVSIRDHLGDGSPYHAYRIEIAPPQRSLQLTIDELQRYVSQTIEVPQGGQMAVILRARRVNVAGPVEITLIDSPAGAELVNPEVPNGQPLIPMMIRATSDATPGASLTSLIGRVGPVDNPVLGKLNQRTMLVRGQNNVDVWGHTTDKLAVAITEPLPFSVAVEQPRVPLTRLGNTEYIVRATRQEGYDDPIDLRVLYNPAGVSSSGSVRIEAGQVEARIPVTANHQAALGVFPVAVLAQGKGTDANRWVSAEFIELEIQDSIFNFSFPKTVLEQGQSGFVTVAVEAKRPPDGEVEIELLGLPAGVSSDALRVKWTVESEQVSFPVSLAADARLGQHQTLSVRAIVSRSEGEILQTQGTGELQIVPPPARPAEQVAAVEPPPAATQPPTKPLTRLEQLRMAKQAESRSDSQ